MKYISFVLVCLCYLNTFAQVAIGKTVVSNSSVSLEFGDYVTGRGRGLISPWVTSVGDLAGAVDGTIAFDTSDKMLKCKQGGQWSNLTRSGNELVDGTLTNINGSVDTTLQDGFEDLSLAKTIIGSSDADTVTGVLVLSDDNKAMILPKVPEPHKNIVNPEPGMMVYDTTNKMLAVFNGKVWFFWKP